MKKMELRSCKRGAPASIEKNGSYWRVCCSKISSGAASGLSLICHDAAHQMKTKKEAIKLWGEVEKELA